MADLEKNILVVIPVNEDHKKFLEEKAASGDKNCCIRYVNGEEVTKEDVEQADVIVGNVDPSLISGAKNLELLQLNSAGADLYIKAGVMPEEQCSQTPQALTDSRSPSICWVLRST